MIALAYALVFIVAAMPLGYLFYRAWRLARLERFLRKCRGETS